ncbi:MAG: flagellar hook capping FlgD N-terminal domain-containing protein [Parvibaculaceae bacterium]|jgi:flagellar basal-body rod modification protein FlgD|nr:flagellar hook capping FlgD N-terminal domain-containing protein [Parvibaculaceae bacterium]HBM88111.1 flagellar hook capping protein [Rhodobiaceae bacterium]|tara:strand:+ start:7705 stop:8400 length:696 start_codon:yes stop_codon:yes gene_type:complete
MLEAVSNTQPVTQAQTTETSASQSAKEAADENFNLFLSLLTTQLQNQDPLDPMDTGEMTNQLVQFSSVEQSIATNSNLEELISLTNSQSSDNAVQYIGKEVEALSTAREFKDGGTSDWRFSIAEDSPEIKISIVDSSGASVYSETLSEDAGTHDFSWNGSLDEGGTAADGTYFLSVTALDADGEPVNTDVRTFGTVDTVDFTSNPPILLVDGLPVSLTSVTSVSEPKDEGS